MVDRDKNGADGADGKDAMEGRDGADGSVWLARATSTAERKEGQEYVPFRCLTEAGCDKGQMLFLAMWAVTSRLTYFAYAEATPDELGETLKEYFSRLETFWAGPDVNLIIATEGEEELVGAFIGNERASGVMLFGRSGEYAAKLIWDFAVCADVFPSKWRTHMFVGSDLEVPVEVDELFAGANVIMPSKVLGEGWCGELAQEPDKGWLDD